MQYSSQLTEIDVQYISERGTNPANIHNKAVLMNKAVGLREPWESASDAAEHNWVRTIGVEEPFAGISREDLVIKEQTVADSLSIRIHWLHRCKIKIFETFQMPIVWFLVIRFSSKGKPRFPASKPTAPCHFGVRKTKITKMFYPFSPK